jgi:hypothetical protein
MLRHFLPGLERIRHCPFVIQDQATKLRQQLMALILAEPSVLFAMLGFAAADMVAGGGAESGKRKVCLINSRPLGAWKCGFLSELNKVLSVQQSREPPKWLLSK